ncbi:hypothetical protein SETIT_9G554100v2 [Setaria italica]|uniref:BHLH domain-containing protein n=1 Tax=Setaria italica TaxID=4555 RepID=K4AI89_SETIT|nr:uncharacterized protein LOC101765829 [Setaria italica]RCV46723.1 hypothetical protein SETIT_9G554100v2 [Setaria italica]
MALSFHPTTAPLFGHLPAADMSFLQDPEVTDALLGFVYDPLDPANAALDDLLNLPLHDDDDAAFLGPLHDDSDGEVKQHCAKKQRACGDGAWRGLADIDATGQLCNSGGNQQVPALPELLNEFVLPLPPPSPPPLPPAAQLPAPGSFVRAAEAKKAAGNVSQSLQSAAARQRRKRISEKTAELSRLIPGGHKMNTAEMLEAAARHVKLLQAQVGMLALMRTVGSTENEKMPSVAQEQMHKLLVRGDVQERLAAEGKCLVPRKLVDAVAKDNSVMSNALVNRELGWFVASLPAGQ